MAEPIGWSSMRGSLHYKSVFPTMPGVGMQVNLHKNLAKRLQPKEATMTVNQCNIDMARRILHRQRVALRLYSGSRLNLKGSTAHETSARLHRPARLNTCPEGIGRDNSETFSMVRSEGSTLLTEASLYGTNLPAIGERRMSPIPSSAQSRLSDRQVATSYEPEKVADTRGYLVRLRKPIVYKKKYTEAEIQGIVKRLSEYDSRKHPAESRSSDDPPSVVPQVPRQSMTRVQKCSAEEVQEIVERLYRFDHSKWPPESKARPKIYSGRPRQIMTAPTVMSRRSEVTSNTEPLPDAQSQSQLETPEPSTKGLDDKNNSIMAET